MLKYFWVQKRCLLLLPTTTIYKKKVKLQKVPELLKSLKLCDTIDQVANEAGDLRLVRAQRQRLIHQVDLVPYLGSLREIAREGVVRDFEED